MSEQKELFEDDRWHHRVMWHGTPRSRRPYSVAAKVRAVLDAYDTRTGDRVGEGTQGRPQDLEGRDVKSGPRPRDRFNFGDRP
jgi:hypothetical protein